MRSRTIFAAVMNLILPLVALAQAPSADWRTFRTENFRVHYPAPYEEWAAEVASKLESIRQAVNERVSFEPAGRTDVIIADPVAQANGSAWPFLGSPRMILWASPPSPAGALGHESDWGELLAIHEWAHVAHLARPSRNRLVGLRWLLSPFALGPIATAPRWVSEGYATVLEGTLTGEGRPYSDYRAVILRGWAQQGRLPSYEQLDSDSENWMGMSMAYLVGSAYLEWLAEREGDESLVRLWARLSARENRSFDEAFTGVYADSPKRLYQRFSAELTHRAMLVEAAAAASMRPGDLWMDLSWTTGEPDVDVDGRRIVTIVRGRRKPSRIVVYETARDEKGEEEERKRIERVLERDAGDFAPVRRRPLPRKPVAEYVFRPGEIVGSPRWIGESGDVLFVRFVPAADGVLHPELYRWNPGSGQAPERLTRQADLRDARPSADGLYALAVRNRFGLSELMQIDLQTGQLRLLAGPSLDEQYVEPAPHPTLPRFAMIQRRERAWHLVVRDLEGEGPAAEIRFDGIVAQPSWSRDGKALFATVARGGFIEIARFDYDAAARVLVERGAVTRSPGASLAAVASNDTLWFLSLDPDGLDLRRLPVAASEEPLPAVSLPAGMAPAVRREFRGRTPEIVRSEIGPAESYGFGRQELSPLFGGGWSPSGSVFEGGVRLGDVIGRLETLALASAGADGGMEGGSLSVRTSRFRLSAGARLFMYEELPSKQKDGHLSQVRDSDRAGAEAWVSTDKTWAGGKGRGSLALYGAEIDEAGSSSISQLGAGIAARVEHAAMLAGGKLAPLAFDVAVNGGSTGDEGWTRVRTGASAGITAAGRAISLALEAGTSGNDAPARERFEIGGTRSSLQPSAATSNLVEIPALPRGVLMGRSFESARLDIAMGGALPVLFAQRVDADVELGDDSVSLAGLEWTLTLDAMPIARIPALELRAGLARVIDDGVLEDETSAWISMRWKP